ncbi:hypothetical protein AB0395_34780 [Streptosporangium sp. NPDC051023]|uniref:hypothetical protein n=1 Tax=Streptosporangium sp. NPDC051023 TaxID=3155410 RepID=UPI00344C0767
MSEPMYVLHIYAHDGRLALVRGGHPDPYAARAEALERSNTYPGGGYEVRHVTERAWKAWAASDHSQPVGTPYRFDTTED